MMASARLSGPLVAPAARFGDTGSPALTEARQLAVRDHLDHILLSSVFRNSKRYAGLLRYVVEETLNGNGDNLKERTIGVEVFGRLPDYDTTADHSVRSGAGEVRKRLAQYYMECGANASPRIELLPGSYIPAFRFAEEAPPERLPEALRVVAAPPVEPARLNRQPGWFPLRFTAIIAIAAVPLLGFTFRSAWNKPAPFGQLWNPILSSTNPIVLCIGGGRVDSAAQPPLTISDYEHSPVRRMNVGDAMALAGLTGVLQSNAKQYRILNRASATSFRDLQAGPFVLIGGMNNEWTLRLMNGLRYTFVSERPSAYISDRQKPGNKAWSFSYAAPYNQPNRDYAIVSRLRDPRTEQTALIVAGIGSWGTQAAGEFVTSPAHLRKLEAFVPRDWEQKNLQVVIATDVIAGSSGPPIVVGAYVW